MWSCEFCGEKEESVTFNDYGVRLCGECRELYSEEPPEFLAMLDEDDIEEHYRAEGW